jgi:hypothetical protein
LHLKVSILEFITKTTSAVNLYKSNGRIFGKSQTVFILLSSFKKQWKKQITKDFKFAFQKNKKAMKIFHPKTFTKLTLSFSLTEIFSQTFHEIFLFS